MTTNEEKVHTSVSFPEIVSPEKRRMVRPEPHKRPFEAAL
jgi:hypothetical protein